MKNEMECIRNGIEKLESENNIEIIVKNKNQKKLLLNKKGLINEFVKVG